MIVHAGEVVASGIKTIQRAQKRGKRRWLQDNPDCSSDEEFWWSPRGVLMVDGVEGSWPTDVQVIVES